MTQKSCTSIEQNAKAALMDVVSVEAMKPQVVDMDVPELTVEG